MRVLGIESTCDETALALVDDGKIVVSEVVHSQVAEHAPWQGIVPEVAARSHLLTLQPLLDKLLDPIPPSERTWDRLAVCSRPGLIGALTVGVSFAKTMALLDQVPLVAVDHLAAHMYSVQLETPLPYPYLTLLVSGGHSLLAKVEGPGRYDVMGRSRDDSVGEAFDKVARLLGLGYPGGPIIDKLARGGDDSRFAFPVAQVDPRERPFDTSFSGLKTAALRLIESLPKPFDEQTLCDLAAGFEKAAIETLRLPTLRAMEATGLKRLAIVGGVAANSRLRHWIASSDLEIVAPPLQWCGDQATMTAALGAHLEPLEPDDLVSLAAQPRVIERNYPFRAKKS